MIQSYIKQIFIKTSSNKTNVIKPYNKIKPIQSEFKSTKDLFTYAKKRCVDALNSSTPYEHALILDTKKNKVISEYIGNSNTCPIPDLFSLNIDKKNTAIIHGHPDSTPISSTDIKTMLKAQVYQIIAINSKGEFSLVSKTLQQDKNINKKFQEFKMDLYTEYNLSNKESNQFIHSVLSKHMPIMGLRYISNYKYLK